MEIRIVETRDRTEGKKQKKFELLFPLDDKII